MLQSKFLFLDLYLTWWVISDLGSDPDYTWRVISDPDAKLQGFSYLDPDLCWIQLRIEKYLSEILCFFSSKIRLKVPSH